MKVIAIVCLVLCLSFYTDCCCIADVLKGGVQHEDTIRTRVKRRSEDSNSTATTESTAPNMEVPRSTRVQRRVREATVNADEDVEKSMLAQTGQLDPEDFISKDTARFDLEAEGGSKELVLAWELWHKQLARAVWIRSRSNASGTVHYKLTVTRDHRLSIEIKSSSGSPECVAVVTRSAVSLDGHPGLTFPEGSKRDVAYDEHVFVFSPYVKPGYSWQKDDFERTYTSY